MRPFQSFVAELRDLASEARAGFPAGFPEAEVKHALNGGPSKALNRLVERVELRDSGVFFTDSAFARRAVDRVSSTVGPKSVILDPACGAGDLLLASTTTLPIGESLQDTLALWSHNLLGRDLFGEFVESAKLRLFLSAVQAHELRGTHRPVRVPEEVFFPGIQQRCGMSDVEAIATATHIVMNPPFALVEAPDECTWGSGRVNAAALFVDACLRHAQPGTEIVAILPDVLRSGSRYNDWRAEVERRGGIREIELWGQFDAGVDVDVFLLHLEVGRSDLIPNWGTPVPEHGRVVRDLFHVTVGPVVDYRDPHDGKSYPFVTSRGLPRWATVSELPQRRLFAGRAIHPPFVVVRRTSRPGDEHRAVATIIDIAEEAAVENHMLVLTPRDGSRSLCEQLVDVLRMEETKVWLDSRIRCRHLTVSAVAELPWLGNDHA